MIVRKILQQLKVAGLIEVARGTGGVTILLKEVVIKKVTKKADMVQSYNCW